MKKDNNTFSRDTIEEFSKKIDVLILKNDW